MLKVVGEKFRDLKAVTETWGDVNYLSMVLKDGALPAALTECADPHDCHALLYRRTATWGSQQQPRTIPSNTGAAHLIELTPSSWYAS